jgi:hypothetical protein
MTRKQQLIFDNVICAYQRAYKERMDKDIQILIKPHLLSVKKYRPKYTQHDQFINNHILVEGRIALGEFAVDVKHTTTYHKICDYLPFLKRYAWSVKGVDSSATKKPYMEVQYRVASGVRHDFIIKGDDKLVEEVRQQLKTFHEEHLKTQEEDELKELEKHLLNCKGNE